MTSMLPYALVSSLAVILVFTSASLDTAQSLDEPSGPAYAWIPWQDWLLPTAGGMFAWVAIIIVVVAVLVFLYLRSGQGHRPRARPLPMASVPSLQSADGHVYFRLDGLDEAGLIIGRGTHGVDLRIDGTAHDADTVSDRHARIYYDSASGHVIIEDLGSSNGVFINGRRAPRKNLLKDGWAVGLGRLTLTYEDGDSDTGPLDTT